MSEYLFWVTVWIIGAASGMVRAARRSEYSNLHDLAVVGLYSGMVSFGIIAFWTGGDSRHVGSEFRYLGFSAILGLGGVEHERIIRQIIQRVAASVLSPQSGDGDDVLGADLSNAPVGDSDNQQIQKPE